MARRRQVPPSPAVPALPPAALRPPKNLHQHSAFLSTPADLAFDWVSRHRVQLTSLAWQAAFLSDPGPFPTHPPCSPVWSCCLEQETPVTSPPPLVGWRNVTYEFLALFLFFKIFWCFLSYVDGFVYLFFSSGDWRGEAREKCHPHSSDPWIGRCGRTSPRLVSFALTTEKEWHH